jgi:hypothetical protein
MLHSSIAHSIICTSFVIYYALNEQYKVVVCFPLSNSPASEFYMPTFRNTLSVPSSYADRCRMTFYTYLPMNKKQRVPKRRHIKFKRRGITQKKDSMQHCTQYHLYTAVSRENKFWLVQRNRDTCRTTRPTPRTHEQSTTLQEPNGSIITAKDTPDGGPVRARNM